LERRRITWVMVGWKRPLKEECSLRWVGSTCPREKKVDTALWSVIKCHIVIAKRRVKSLLSAEAYVMTAE
jgi:hypothetical protein